MLLLLQFLFDHSEIFTGETRHIVPPYNKAGISNFFLLRISEIAEITAFFKTLLFLQFLFNHSEFFTGETRHIVPPYNKGKFCLKFQVFQELGFAQNCCSSFSSRNHLPFNNQHETLQVGKCIKTQVGIEFWDKWTIKVQTVAL